MGDIRYASGKLYVASFDLVKAGEIRDRLYNAFIYHLGPVFESDFPEDLQDDVKFVRNAFVSVLPHGNADNIRESLAALSDEEAEKLAEKILDLAFRSAELSKG